MSGPRNWFTSFTLLLVLATVLAACGGQASQPAEQPTAAAPAPAAQATDAPAQDAAAQPTDAPAAQEAATQPAAAGDDVVTIEYWQYAFDARVKAMNELIAKFEAENPGIKVVHNSEIPYEQFRDKIAASVPAGVGPDVVTLFYGWVPAWVDAGYIVPLPQDQFPAAEIESTFTPLVKDARFKDQYYTLPTAVRTLALFWNKDLFKEAGLDPDKPPQTLDEFVEYAKKLTKTDEAGNITQEGFATEMTGQAHQWFREVLLRQYGGQPYSDDNKTVQWNSEQGCKAFTWLSAFETEYKTGSNDLFDGSTEAFLQGKEALHIDGSFRLGSISENAPDLNFGVAELPVGPDGTKSTFGSYWTHGITTKAAADPKRQAAAVKFLKFITTPEAGTLWVNTVGELPAQLKAANDPKLKEDPKLGAFAAGLPYAHATFFVDEAKQRQFMVDAYDAVRLTGADPCEVLNDAAAQEQALYDEFWAKQ